MPHNAWTCSRSYNKIIDIAIPGDTRVIKKEEEKTEKYQELGFELGRLWKVKTKVVPIVIGALGAISDRLISYLAEIGAELSFETIQKSPIRNGTDLTENPAVTWTYSDNPLALS